MNFRADIQGLRAIAVLSVMLFHFNPVWLPGGFIGVDVFLVISGYLIVSILLYKKTKFDYSLFKTLKDFYTSRFKRIIPAYFITLILVTIISSILFLPQDFLIYKESLRQALWFNSNNYFADFGDYFAPANHEQPLLHTWSLAIEIQFYLLAPFVFLLTPKKYLNWLLLIAILVFTIAAEYRLHTGLQQSTYYSLLARLPAFFTGGCVALWLNKEDTSKEKNSKNLLLSVLAVTLIVFALFQPKLTNHFPGIAALIPIIGAALIIANKNSNVIVSLLSNKVMVWIGGLSYSLYLWHWPVLAFIRYYTGTEVLSVYIAVLFVIVTLSLSIASYYFVETKMRVIFGFKKIFSYGLLLFMTVFVFLNSKNINMYFTPEQLPIEYRRYADPATICHGKVVDECLKGDLRSEFEVLVLGDSHAAMLNRFFDHLGKEIGFKARIITGSSCVTIPNFDYHRIPEWAHEACLNQIDVAKEHISNSKMIFLASYWSWHFQSNDFIKSLDMFLKENEDIGNKVYLMAQEPMLTKNPQRSVRFSGMGVDAHMSSAIGYQNANSQLIELSGNYKNSFYLNFESSSFFDSVPFYKQELIYFDEHHLNEIGALNYAIEVEDEMRKIISTLKRDYD